MKINYTFDPYEDKEDLLIFHNAKTTYTKLKEVESYLRKLRKYDERDVIPKQEIVDAIYEILTESYDEYF